LFVKQLVLATLALSIAAFAPVSSHLCRDTQEQVIQPIQDVIAYLETRPSMEALAGPGCVSILETLKRLPSGARAMRALGAHGVENTRSLCTTSVNSIRYPCTIPALGTARCLPEAYSYCVQWEYSMTNQPKYELAMELSTQVESAYDKAQQLCGAAMNHDEAVTSAAAKDLLSYLSQRIAPDSDKLYDLSCGDGSVALK
jgi:hypothetical protein